MILLPATVVYGRGMSGSSGADLAAQQGRGTRFEEGSQEYTVMLPPLPTGSVVLNTVFLHAHVKGRPYHIEDFRDALRRLSLLTEVIGLGAYKMNHVWAVTFKTAEGKKKMLATPEMTVMGRRCIVIDPCNQDVRIKLHWLLFHVADDDVRAALSPYGKVLEVVREKWRVDGCVGVSTTTRTAVLRLKGGVTLDDIPHQLRIAGEYALVVVPGRAPLCLRCERKGHIRRECRVPRCSVCHRFGHNGTECVKTYASATAPAGSDEKSELFMDEADAEEVAAVEAANAAVPTAPAPCSEDTVPSSDDAAPVTDDTVTHVVPAAPSADRAPALQEAASDVEKNETTGVEVALPDAVPKQSAGDAPMDVAAASAGCPSTKRTREEADPDLDTESQEEQLPSKTTPLRRRRLQPTPNLPKDDRRAAKPPP